MDKQLTELTYDLQNKLTRQKAKYFRYLHFYIILGIIGISVIMNIYSNAEDTFSHDPSLLTIVFILSFTAFTVILLACGYMILLYVKRYHPLWCDIARIIQADEVEALNKLVVEVNDYSNRKLPHFGKDFIFYPKCGLLIKYDDIMKMYDKRTINFWGDLSGGFLVQRKRFKLDTLFKSVTLPRDAFDEIVDRIPSSKYLERMKEL